MSLLWLRSSADVCSPAGGNMLSFKPALVLLNSSEQSDTGALRTVFPVSSSKAAALEKPTACFCPKILQYV